MSERQALRSGLAIAGCIVLGIAATIATYWMLVAISAPVFFQVFGDGPQAFEEAIVIFLLVDGLIAIGVGWTIGRLIYRRSRSSRTHG